MTEAAERTIRWTEFARVTIAAVLGGILAVFASGKAEGRSAERLDRVVIVATEHESRIRSVESVVSSLSTDLRWLREALRTGRDPVTDQPLGVPGPVRPAR